MVFVNLSSVVLLPVFLHICITVTSTAGKSITSRHGPLDANQPPLMRHFSKESPVIGQWAMTMLGDEPVKMRDGVDIPHRGLPLAKRSSNEGDVPLGIGVLSNMAKFFDQLRGNLDSVEELGPHNQIINPDQASANAILEMLHNNGAIRGGDPLDAESLNVLPAQVRHIISGGSVPRHRNKAYSYTGLGK